jgi:hypothetical protein
VTLDDIEGSYRFRHLAVTSQAQIDTQIADSQQCFDHVTGPLFAADFFDFGEEQYAFLTGHHLVVDLVTWRLLCLLSSMRDTVANRGTQTLISPELSGGSRRVRTLRPRCSDFLPRCDRSVMLG